jgi:2,4-dienoyl-CoA reductase-like NADH-dependent reductase (Old Yellow Enzyme family)
MSFPKLFEPYQMARVRLRNRLVLAGHGSRFIDHDTQDLSARQADYLAERAHGGVGLIIQGSSMVHPTGLALPGVQNVWKDESIPAYARVTDAVHEGGAAIFGQLSHLGRQGHGFGTRELWAPSPLPDGSIRVVPHAVRRSEIEVLVDAFRSGAERLMRARFDGIEVYLAHGYLLSEFISPLTNHREDEYGGSLENRLRLPMRVLDAVRQEVGSDVPVGIRISADELVPGGLELPEASEAVRRVVAEQQLEYVSVSQSNYASIEAMIPDMSFDRAPFVHYAKAIREVSGGVPVMAVARIVTPEKSEEILADGVADFVCMVRPLIADPEFPNKARDGRREEIRECISCNVGCRGGPHRGTTIMCLVNPAIGEERDWGFRRLTPAESRRRVVVVGGGPGGLKAAETAALRGHSVTLFEAQQVLGGQVLAAASAMPYRDEFAGSVRFLEAQVRRLGVQLRLGWTASAADVLALEPDVVIVATGSRPGRPQLPGCDGDNVITIHDVLAGVDVRGPSVVLVDCGESDWKCLTVAERLAADGHRVTLVSPVPVGIEIDQFSRPPLIRRLRRAGVEFVEHAALVAAAPGVVTVRDVWTDERWDLGSVDEVVVSWYGTARDELLLELDELDALEVHGVGDCQAPRRAIDAIRDGFRVGRGL